MAYTGFGEEPRAYQLELLEAARKQNVIACLETGSGKTLIAALLIAEYLGIDSGSPEGPACIRDDGKIVVFAVERVPLVLQQEEYVRRVLGGRLSTGIFHGDMGLDTWDEKSWKKSLDGKNALFMTAQVLLNALRHGVLDWNRIALLVLDEAHHTTKLHPFCSIMREFYHPCQAEGVPQPRVFGMTASPVKVKGSAQTIDGCTSAIETLQINLDARVAVVTGIGRDDLMSHVRRPGEFVCMYQASRFDDIMGVDSISDSKDANPSTRTIPAAADKGVENALGSYGEAIVRFMTPREDTDEDSSRFRTPTPFITEKVIKLAQLLVSEQKRWSQTDHQDSFRCIVFVHRRNIAAALAGMLSELFRPFECSQLLARAVVGAHGASGGLKQSQASQRSVLQAFRQGEFGVLVSTSVVEEGLDVPACSLVVMFDPPLSPKSYIQCRGRARHAEGRYIFMVPSSGDEKRTIDDTIRMAVQGEEVMSKVVSWMSFDTVPDGSTTAQRRAESVKEALMYSEPVLRSSKTKARLPASAAISALYFYCLSLPHDRYVLDSTSHEPKFALSESRDGFLCTVGLPLESPVREGVCEEPQRSKQIARRLAALDAYRQLYECGALDEHLFPRDYSTRFRGVPWKQVDNLSGASTTNRGKGKTPEQPSVVRKSETRVRTCKFRQPTTPVDGTNDKQSAEVERFLYAIKSTENFDPDAAVERFTGVRAHGIVCAVSIPDDDLEAVVPPSCTPLFTLTRLGTVKLRAEDIELLNAYRTEVRNVALNISTAGEAKQDAAASDPAQSSGCDPSPMTGISATSTDEQAKAEGFYVIPLLEKELASRSTSQNGENANSIIDWKAIGELVRFDETVWPDASEQKLTSEIEYSLVQSRHDSSYRVYISGGIDRSKTLDSSCIGTVGGGSFATFREYYKARFGVQDLRYSSQNIMEAFSKQKIGCALRGNVFFLIPELCRNVPLSPWAILYVSRMSHWQTYLGLRAFQRSVCDSHRVSFQGLATAMQPRRSGIHLEGRDYERMEFLGDAILKLIATCAVFAKQPLDHEGLLTSARDELVNNTALCDVAMRIHAQSVVGLTEAPNRVKTWPWYGGKPEQVEVELSEKLLADVIESLLALHYLECGMDAAWSFAFRLGVVSLPTHELRTLCTATNQEQPAHTRADRRLLSPRLDEVEGIIGYKFRRRELLVQALTHASFDESEVGSYQRLEFLGDGVIGFIVLHKFYHQYENLSPAELTLLREPALSNELFGRVAISHNLQEHMWHSSKSLERDIGTVTEIFNDPKADAELRDGVALPKVLGDLLESIIGAVTLDQDMMLDEATKVVERLIGPALETSANPATLMEHPVTGVSHAVQAMYKEGPEFVFTRQDTETDERMSDVSAHVAIPKSVLKGGTVIGHGVTCTVRAAGKEIGFGYGPNKRIAKKKAATIALQKLAELKAVKDACGVQAKSSRQDQGTNANHAISSSSGAKLDMVESAVGMDTTGDSS